MSRLKRNTIQRALVLEAVNRLKSHATAAEIYEAISKDHPSVGRATIYRNLNQLAEDGLIRKMVIPGGPDRYDHLCHRHYHAMCEGCGKVFDIDMPYIGDLEKRIRDAHGFAVSGHNIMFNGLCPKCQKRSGFSPCP